MSAPRNGSEVTSAGAMASERVHATPPRFSKDIVERLKRLEDLTGTIADIFDQLGLRGAIGASRLRPTIGDARIVGTAVTVRNVAARQDPHISATTNNFLMAEVEGIHQAGPGDVLVIEGVPDISNMGGIVASLAAKQGMAGAVVDGGVRDIAHSRRIGFPIWSKDISPITGKWRCITEEVNCAVNIGDVTVYPGDLVVADETGVCFVPRDKVEEVVAKAELLTQKEEDILKRIDAGMTIPELVARVYPARK